ncbi:MAG: hypothetical protein ACHQ51_00300 [Elusimicrobiota bacterium]
MASAINPLIAAALLLAPSVRAQVSVTFSLADVPSLAGTVPADVPWLTSPAAANKLRYAELRDFADKTRRCIAARGAVIAACYSQLPDPDHLKNISILKNFTLERCLAQILNYDGAAPCR